jgi:hypothetical protein
LNSEKPENLKNNMLATLQKLFGLNRSEGENSRDGSSSC